MLQTYPVRQPPQGERGADEVAELPGAVIGGGIVVDVIMNVLFVYMGTDEELILALCPVLTRSSAFLHVISNPNTHFIVYRR